MKSLLDAMAMNRCKSMATPGSKGQESSRVETEKLDPQEHREFRSGTGICQFVKEQRFDIAFSTKDIMREAAGPTTASKTKLKRIARCLKGRQRCVLNVPWVGKLDDVIHVTVDADWAGDPKTRCSTSGGVLAIGPCFTVRHWSVTRATVSLSSAESEAKAITKGCIEALYVKHLLEHQTARPFEIDVWTDSSSPKANMQRLGPGRRAKHLEVQTMWVVEQDLSHLAVHVAYAKERGRFAYETRSKSSIRQAARNVMGYTFLDEETQKLQEHTDINQNYWNQKLALLRDYRCSTMECTNRWKMMFTGL